MKTFTFLYLPSGRKTNIQAGSHNSAWKILEEKKGSTKMFILIEVS